MESKVYTKYDKIRITGKISGITLIKIRFKLELERNREEGRNLSPVKKPAEFYSPFGGWFSFSALFFLEIWI